MSLRKSQPIAIVILPADCAQSCKQMPLPQYVALVTSAPVNTARGADELDPAADPNGYRSVDRQTFSRAISARLEASHITPLRRSIRRTRLAGLRYA